MIKTLLLLIFFCLSLVPQIAYALIIKTIDELHPLQVTLSQQSLNRIAVENSGIRKVIAPEGLLDIQIDDVTSQAFITVIEPVDRPIAISVITDSGYVQDIEISSKDKPIETVLLKEPKKGEETEKFLPRKLITKVIASLIQSTLPHGYVASKVLYEDIRKLRNQGLQIQALEAIEGPYEKIVKYKLINTSQVKTPLKESNFATPKDLWIFLEKDILQPNEKTQLIIATTRD